MAAVFSELNKQTISALLEKAGYSASVRGETLGVKDFAVIANVFFEHSKNKK
jgi:hypothetical protein